MRFAHSLVTRIALFALLVPAALADPVDIDALRGLVASGRCGDALRSIDELPRRERRMPDVRVLEANCLLNEGREIEQVYLKERYRRTLVGRGGSALAPQVTRSFYVRRVSFDEKARTRALSLFRSALEAAPDRPDILVGTVAAYANAEAEKDAAAILRNYEGFLDAGAARDIGLVVSDRLSLRDEEGARVIADALSARLPDYPDSWLALLRVALAQHDTASALHAVERMKPLPEGGREALRETARRLVFERRWGEVVPITLEMSQRDAGALVLLALARDRAAFGSGAAIWRELDRRAGPRRDPTKALTATLAHYVQLHADGLEPDADLHLSASRYLARKGALEPAIAEVDACLEKAPGNGEAWLHLAALLRAQFEFELALDAATQAALHAEGETLASAISMRGRLLFALGQDREALAALETGGENEAYVRGLVHLALGNGDAAKTWLARAAAGDDGEAALARAQLTEIENAAAASRGSGG